MDYASASHSYWDSLGLPYFTLAITFPHDTNGKKISNCQDALNSNRSINYAQIYFSPKISADNATFRSKVIAHELGHVMGLGHVPDGASYHSIMKQGDVGYKTPQSHERTDLNSMYGF